MCKSHTFWTDNSHVCIRTNWWGWRGGDKRKNGRRREKRSCCLPHFVSQYYLSSFHFFSFHLFFYWVAATPISSYNLFIISLINLILLSLSFVPCLCLCIDSPSTEKIWGSLAWIAQNQKKKRKKKEKKR